MPLRSPYPSEERERARRVRAADTHASLTELAATLVPPGQDRIDLSVGGDTALRLSHLDKPFWPGITKGDLIRYYVSVAPVLLPHLRDRAMVMKRYPDGASGPSFFMKRAPKERPSFVQVCSVEHASGSTIDYVIINDMNSLLWLCNLGCIDLHPWYARCDDIDRPDTLCFDLDPTPGATFQHVIEAALAVRSALDALGMPSFVKTTGSRGIHIYVPLERGPTQKQVWTFAKAVSNILALQQPGLLTAEYRVAERPRQRVLIDYNQNAWGRTLASVYSVRPTAEASVSTPVSWGEVEAGFSLVEHRLQTVPSRVERLGDLWAPLLDPEHRVNLDEIV
jgi:bifunctional non-homologous end joining protein LigD